MANLFQNLPSSWRAVSCGPRSACSNDMYVANVNSGAMLRVPCCNNYTDESSCNDPCTWNDASGDASGYCGDVNGNFSDVVNYINTDKAIEIIIGILSSVVIAFTVGAFVQWVSRLLLSYQYQKKAKT